MFGSRTVYDSPQTGRTAPGISGMRQCNIRVTSYLSHEAVNQLNFLIYFKHITSFLALLDLFLLVADAILVRSVGVSIFDPYDTLTAGRVKINHRAFSCWDSHSERRLANSSSYSATPSPVELASIVKPL